MTILEKAREKMEVNQMNSTMLAFVGDSYYDLKVREMLCRRGINKPNRLASISSQICFCSCTSHDFSLFNRTKSLNREGIRSG